MTIFGDDDTETEETDNHDDLDEQIAQQEASGAVQTEHRPDPRDNGSGNDQDDGDWQPDDDLVEVDPPRMNTKRWRQWIRTKRWLKKREKLLGDGYIEWWLVGDTVERQFIKPDQKGGGIPEKEVDGDTYLFPRSALVPSEGGMWTCIHKRGEADPINLNDPAKESIPSDVLKEYLDLRVSATAPGILEGLGIDMGDLLKIGIGLIIAYGAASSMGVI